jgi:hypothetical protein
MTHFFSPREPKAVLRSLCSRLGVLSPSKGRKLDAFKRCNAGKCNRKLRLLISITFVYTLPSSPSSGGASIVLLQRIGRSQVNSHFGGKLASFRNDVPYSFSRTWAYFHAVHRTTLLHLTSVITRLPERSKTTSLLPLATTSSTSSQSPSRLYPSPALSVPVQYL